MYRIASATSSSATLSEDQITISPATGDAIAGLHVQAVDDLGFTHHLFQRNDGEVWLAAFPSVKSDGVTGTPVQIDRPFWAETIVDATDEFASV